MLYTLPPLWAFVALLAVHWLGDFVLQSHWMSINKSKRMDALAEHVVVYTITILIGSTLLFGATMSVVAFIVVNGVAHFATDFVTSRITSTLWKRERIHDFFVVIGVDQFIHQFTLAATMWWLLVP
mgnify:CR=1 FL=1